MENFICTTCGTQFLASEKPPRECPICNDERQYINWNGQEWTTLNKLQTNHHNILREIEPHLFEIYTSPSFAIGQRGLIIQSKKGNVLWDCISLIDEVTVKAINAIGGINSIAISHPHYYSSMAEWSKAFGNAPIYLHTADKKWVMNEQPSIKYWEGEYYNLNDKITLINCGGHFKGGTVLHWSDGYEGKGALLTGDIIQVVQDRRYVSFMYSYPNLIPLNVKQVKRILNAVNKFEFDRIHGAWFGKTVTSDAKRALQISAERYINAIKES